MTWASHIMVGAATAKVFGLNYVLTTLGAILPDLMEMFSKKMTHRGVSHSVAISLGALVLLWTTPIRDAWIGVVFGHLFMDSLTMMGVPLLDERSRRITIFGGKLRTGSPGEFILEPSGKGRRAGINSIDSAIILPIQYRWRCCMKATISPKYQVVIPRELREALHLKPGEKVEFLQYENRIEMIPVRDIKKMRGYLKGIDTSVDREKDRL